MAELNPEVPTFTPQMRLQLLFPLYNLHMRQTGTIITELRIFWDKVMLRLFYTLVVNTVAGSPHLLKDGFITSLAQSMHNWILKMLF